MTTTQAGRIVGGLAPHRSTSPPVVRPDPSVRRTARTVGVLFLAGYLAYGVGSLLATGNVDERASRSGDRRPA